MTPAERDSAARERTARFLAAETVRLALYFARTSGRFPRCGNPDCPSCCNRQPVILPVATA